jgi:hypothetical protein
MSGGCLYKVHSRYPIRLITVLTVYTDQLTIPLSLVCLFMVFNATFSNILAISWRSVLLVEEIGVPGENHPHVSSH